MQDGVLDITKDQSNVLCVDGGGEVVVKRLLLLISALAPEALHQEFLHVIQFVRFACVIIKVVLDRDSLNLLLKQVCLIKEEDDRDFGENTIVDNGLEDVE